MINSRDISMLRDDVEANCRTLLAKCAEQGYKAGLSCTYRDQEYQTYLHNKSAKTPTLVSFHGARLAFDVYLDVGGKTVYDNLEFWTFISALGKKMGFTWGGDWKNVDKPHFQWDAGGKYTDSMVRAGRYPPEMPKGEIAMDGEIVKYNSYTHIIKLPKSNYRIDFATCAQPKETLGSFYARQKEKPEYIINGGFFALNTGNPVFNYTDNGKVKSTDPHQMGMGINDGVMTWGCPGGFNDFISGYPYLVHDGKKLTPSYAKEIDGKNPRTAIGYNNEYYYLPLVDGRTAANKGMTLGELADMFIAAGAKYAMNLDGGGSTRGLHWGKVINKPTENRAVDNVICAYRKDGVQPPATYPILRKGGTGDDVKTLQSLLNAKGYNCGAVDGDFGVKTYTAAKSFQKAKGLAVDGIVGNNTWGKLLN
ncbi:MAG: hypothetical protein EOM54_13465 [Clostridia bacterium]|nr:hypothetical protein [Clostridia bacterium]